MAQATPTSLVRGIGRWDLVALGVNFIVGAGIFGLPGKVYSISGSASLIAYVLCALAVTLIILCFAEVGSRFDVTGGPYLYAREACGPLIGFEVGWLRWVSGVTTFAANCTLLVDYLSYLCPAANAGVWRAVVITTAILLLTTINVLGVREGAVASNILAVAKLLPLLLLLPSAFSSLPRRTSRSRPDRAIAHFRPQHYCWSLRSPGSSQFPSQRAKCAIRSEAFLSPCSRRWAS